MFSKLYEVSILPSEPTEALENTLQQPEGIAVVADNIEQALEISREYLKTLPVDAFYQTRITEIRESYHRVFIADPDPNDIELVFTPEESAVKKTSGIFSGDLPKGWEKTNHTDSSWGL